MDTMGSTPYRSSICALGTSPGHVGRTAINYACPKTMTDLLDSAPDESLLDLGCVAAHGWFCRNADGQTVVTSKGKPATAFLMELIARLQEIATVPMIEVRAYSRWLKEE